MFNRPIEDYWNIWIKSNGEVLFVDYLAHEKGYTQDEIEYNEKYWIKVSDGMIVGIDRNEGVIRGRKIMTQAQKNKLDLIFPRRYL